jgi:hypothetical protein
MLWKLLSSSSSRLLYTRSSTNKRRRHHHGCNYCYHRDTTILKASSSTDAVNHAATAMETNDTSSNDHDDSKNNHYDNDEEEEEEIIQKSMEYLANLIQVHLDSKGQHRNSLHYEKGSMDDQDGGNNDPAAAAHGGGGSSSDDDIDNNIGYQLAKGRFVDLTTTIEGEELLERLFLLKTTATTTTTTTINNDDDDSSIPSSQSDDETVVTPPPSTTTSTQPNKRIIQYAITTLQSLLIYGMQIGVKGSEESQKKMVRHLFRRTDTDTHHSLNDKTRRKWISHWDSECIRRLKFYRDITLGKQLLGQLIRKRTSKGAFDLLVEMGVWDRHTDVALLRSGFPVRFTDDELVVSMEAEKEMKKEEEGGDDEHYKDPDEILGIRCDLREQKIYTIDSASTLDIDDGIAVEVLGDDNGDDSPRHRYWIHIADVDRWAPRGSKLLSVAERRGTSLYLPTMTLCMFPPK